jgi:hypothetical protein
MAEGEAGLATTAGGEALPRTSRPMPDARKVIDKRTKNLPH